MSEISSARKLRLCSHAELLCLSLILKRADLSFSLLRRAFVTIADINEELGGRVAGELSG